MVAELACIILDGRDLFCLEHFAPVTLNLEFLFQAIFYRKEGNVFSQSVRGAGNPPDLNIAMTRLN
jgi:hypothetical protein